MMTLDPNGIQDAGFSTRDPGCNAFPDVVIPILRSGVLAEEFCRSVRRAKVEAVFERCLYLRSGNAVICVGEPGIGNGPLTLIGVVGSLANPGLQPGRSAAVCDRHITIGNSVRFTLGQSKTWRSPAWPICVAAARLIETCAALARRAAIEAPQESLTRHVSGVPETSGRQPPSARIARPRIIAFERWLSGVLDARHARVMASEDAVQGLVGLGPGLTPSGDDFLVGALASLDAIGEHHAHAALAHAIPDPLLGLTVPLSACFLKAAAARHVGEALHGVISSIITGDVDSAVAAADKIGHSSGWDMMAGIMATLRIAAAARLKTFVAHSSIASGNM